MKRRKLKKMERLNLIPILDSVFIFIFFLLMSTQFIHIYEIGSDAPSIKTTDSIKNELPPLNLTLVIEKNRILLKTGIPGKTYREIANFQEDYDLTTLFQELTILKEKHSREKSIIFRPEPSVPYKDLVRIMDHVRAKKDAPELFEQIIFETII